MRRRGVECIWDIHVFFLVANVSVWHASVGMDPYAPLYQVWGHLGSRYTRYKPSSLLIRVRAALSRITESGTTRSKRPSDRATRRGDFPAQTSGPGLGGLPTITSHMHQSRPAIFPSIVAPHVPRALEEEDNCLSSMESWPARSCLIGRPLALHIGGNPFLQPAAFGMPAPQSSACSACAAAVRGPAPAHSGMHWGSWGSM